MTLPSLNHNQLRFVAEFLSVMPRNATAAYLRVYGGTNATARAAASDLMADPRVAAEIERWERETLGKLSLTAEDVLTEIFLVATADPRELSEHHVGACRHCHGDGHEYQRTPAEYAADLETYAASKAGKLDPYSVEFPMRGGIGFNPYRDPHPACPECFGKGRGFEVFKDTRNLSPGAARLYDGVKKTKDGLEIKVRNREKSLDLAAQFSGVARKAVELTGKDGGPIRTIGAGVTVAALDAVSASHVYQELMGGS